ncbi:hypothetical protein FQN55_003501 [Onygenales sp. PD_40]|nr:hypothetical protein FQN55_003501 [Onygenales sp. PD_40]
MAYPQRGPPPRQYSDRPPPQNYEYQNQGRGGYGPGPQNGGYDGRGQYYDDRGYGGHGGRGQYDQNPYPSRGRGPPPPNQYGYGDRRPMNAPPGPPPQSRADKPYPRPPPQQRGPRYDDRPPRSPGPRGPATFDNPFPAFPVRRRNSTEIDRQMGALAINDGPMRPPEQRPHTSNSNRPYPSRQQPDMPWGAPGGRNMGPPPDDAGPRMGPPKRSATMPVNQGADSPQYPGQHTWKEPPMPRPGTATGSKPGPSGYSGVAPIPEIMPGGGSSAGVKELPDDFLDDYFDPSDPPDSDMPNFNAMPDSSNDTRERDIVPLDKPKANGTSTPDSGNGYTAYRPPGGVAPLNPRKEPETNQFENAGFQFDLPPSPSVQYDQGQPVDNYGQSMNGGYPQRQPSRGMAAGPAYRGRGGAPGGYGPPRPPPNQYGPPGQGPPMSYPDEQQGYQNMRSNQAAGPSPVDPPQNPDALPHHPAPFRPGLDQGSKPPPIRQYDNPPPVPVQAPLGRGGPLPPLPDGRPVSATITHAELQRLQQTAKGNPSDQKTQLVLAKKLVEASIHLIDDGGRADQKTRNKNRERYIFDAHKMVKKLVSAGYPPAMFYLADCYGQGLLGLEADPKEAFSLYQSAAKGGHSESAYRLAVCCEMGYEGGGGTKRDPMKAVQWYRRAAALGDTPAMYKMGMILLKGLLGQPRNPREAVSWLKRAAERADADNPHALHELALLYENPNGNDAIIQDEAYSRELLEQASDLGYKFSQYRLATAYEYGLLGCPVDPRQSIIYYTQAAAQGEHQSELALSGWYLTGAEGILQQSDTEAYLWARKAAMAGLAKAEYAMGYFTEVGIGVPTNLEDAKRWYWKASSQNFMKARERLEELRRGGAKMQKTRVSRSAVNKQNEGDCIVM